MLARRRCSSGRARAARARRRSARRARSPGRASANAACACRHLSEPVRPAPPTPSSSEAPPSRPVSPPASSRRIARCSSSACARLAASAGSLCGALRPALDAAGRLEPRDRGDEVAARHVVRRRERLAVGVVRALLGDRRPAERAADGDAAERARLAADLSRDDRAVGQRPRWAIMLARSRFRHWLMPLTMKRCSPGRT